MTGGVVWYFFILPISFFLTTLNVFKNELPEIELSHLLQHDYLFYIIFAYLLIWKLILSDQPLKENKDLFLITKNLIFLIIKFIIISNIILIFIFTLSNYPEYVYNQIYSLFILVIVVPFYLIFSVIFDEKFVTSSRINELLLSTKGNILKRKKTIITIISILLIVTFYVGSNFVRPTYTISKNSPIKLEIETIRILETYYPQDYIDEYSDSGNISGNFTLEQDYSISFGLISWIKFKPNISLLDDVGKPYPTNSNIYFSGDYVIVNESRLKIKNITLYGKRYENKLLKIYNVKTEEVDENIQRWDIEFINPYNCEIEINEILISKDDKLKLIKYEENNLSLNTIKLNYNIENQLAHSLLEIYDIKFKNNNFANHSIILFFEKTK